MHCFTYSIKFQGLNNLFFYFVYTNMKLYHPSSLYPLSPAYVHLPHHGKKFCTKERRIFFVYLGVINLWFEPLGNRSIFCTIVNLLI